jgi:hypothetical protein
MDFRRNGLLAELLAALCWGACGIFWDGERLALLCILCDGVLVAPRASFSRRIRRLVVNDSVLDMLNFACGVHLQRILQPRGWQQRTILEPFSDFSSSGLALAPLHRFCDREPGLLSGRTAIGFFAVDHPVLTTSCTSKQMENISQYLQLSVVVNLVWSPVSLTGSQRLSMYCACSPNAYVASVTP